MRSSRLGIALLVMLFGAPLLALLSASPTSAAPEFCALDDPGIDDPGIDAFRWTGGSGAWEDATHWQSEAEALGGPEDNRAPDNTLAEEGYVCIDAPGHTITIGDGIEARVQAVDVSAGTELVLDLGKLFVYGTGERTSYFRAEGAGRSRVELIRGVFGGPGATELHGDLVWRSLVTGPSTISTTPCIVVNASCPDLEPNPGRLTVMPGGLIDVDGRGVNLFDRYIIEVGGALRLSGDPAYVAADRNTTLHVLETGTFDIAGDGNVFEGFARGVPEGTLATFRNDGVVVKSAGDGISAINATYEQSATGRVAVATGSLNLPDGHNAAQVDGAVTAYVRPGGSLGTASCEEKTSGLCVPGSVEEDAQDAELTIPATAGDGAEVALYEEESAQAPDGQPLISVGTSDLDGEEVTLELRTYGAPVDLPDKSRWRLYHGSTKDTFRRARRCSQVEEQEGVVGCVRGTESGGAVVLTIDTSNVAGWWTARGDAHVYGRPDRAVNDGLGIATVDLDAHCVTEPGGAVDWEFVSRWRTQPTNDHATGWDPTGPGQARGTRVAAPAGDLAELVPTRGGFQVLLSVPGDELEGVALLTRHESETVTWKGVASIALSDTTTVVGEPGWRLLDDAGLDFTWTKYDGGVPVGEPVEATVAQLIATHSPAKSTAAEDTIALGFGCAGERVLVDDLRVSGSARADDDAWDFEADQPDVALKGGDIGSECQVSGLAYPLVKKRTIALSHRGEWQIRQGQDSRSDFATRLLQDSSGPTDGRTVKLTLRKKGKLLAYLKGTGKLRAASSLAIDVKVSPVIDITDAPRKVFKGQDIVVRGRFAPHDRVPYKILVDGPGGTDRLSVVGAIRRANAEGSFQFKIEASELGTYAIALQAEPTGKLSRAVSRRAVAVVVKERPDPPEPVLLDFEDDGGTDDDGYATAPTPDNDGIEFRLGRPFLPRVGSCLWFANR